MLGFIIADISNQYFFPQTGQQLALRNPRKDFSSILNCRRGSSKWALITPRGQGQSAPSTWSLRMRQRQKDRERQRIRDRPSETETERWSCAGRSPGSRAGSPPCRSPPRRVPTTQGPHHAGPHHAGSPPRRVPTTQGPHHTGPRWEEDTLKREGPPGCTGEAEFRPHRPQQMPHLEGCKGQCPSVVPTRSAGTGQHEPLEAGKLWDPFVTQ